MTNIHENPHISSTEEARKWCDSQSEEFKESSRYNSRESYRYLIAGEAAGLAVVISRLPTGHWIDFIGMTALVLFSAALLFAIRARFFEAAEAEELNAKWHEWSAKVATQNTASLKAGESQPPTWPDCPLWEDDPKWAKNQLTSQGLLTFGAVAMGAFILGEVILAILYAPTN